MRFSLAIILLCFVSPPLLTTQKGTEDYRQGFTGYPPSVYMQFFFPCSSDSTCTRTAEFQVDPMPDRCCILTVTNGDGRGTDEVRSYEVILNGERVVAAGHSRNAQAAIKVLRNNTLKVVLSGEAHSKIFVLIAYGRANDDGRRERVPTSVSETLLMDWTRGDAHYGPDFIQLHSPCQREAEKSCVCVADFKVISSGANSNEFANYVTSFGHGEVPVTYSVRYSANGLFLGAQLLQVGNWTRDKFHPNDGLLGVKITFHAASPGQVQRAKIDNPGECFPPNKR
jgi:hypothetical protein